MNIISDPDLCFISFFIRLLILNIVFRGRCTSLISQQDDNGNHSSREEDIISCLTDDDEVEFIDEIKGNSSSDKNNCKLRMCKRPPKFPKMTIEPNAASKKFKTCRNNESSDSNVY